MTLAGFPHSDIHGSKLDRQLPVAFRSRTANVAMAVPVVPVVAACAPVGVATSVTTVGVAPMGGVVLL